MLGSAGQPADGIESVPVVGDFGVQPAVGAPHADSDASGTRVAPGVGQRLAEDAQHLDARCAERTGGDPVAHVQLDLAVDRHRAMHGDERLQQFGERRVPLASQTQVADRPAQLLAHWPPAGMKISQSSVSCGGIDRPSCCSVICRARAFEYTMPCERASTTTTAAGICRTTSSKPVPVNADAPNELMTATVPSSRPEREASFWTGSRA